MNLKALKALQAEWRDGPEGMSKGERDIYCAYRKDCADALTPHILQQERDRALFKELIAQAQQQNECYGASMSNSLSKVIEQARSRLKEME